MGYLQRFDAKATGLISGIPPAFRPVMSVLTYIGEPPVVLTLGFGGFLSAIYHQQTAIARSFIYAALAFALNTLLKLALHRRRPHGRIVQTLGVPSYSFPSGHAFGTVIFYGLFAYLDVRDLNQPWASLIAGLLALVIVLIGLSRVYLGAHYPSDVLAGWLLGLLSLSAVAALAFS